MPNPDGLTDREAAIDVLIRFVCALDEGDPDLSASSLTEDATLELAFTHNGAKPHMVDGRDAIVDLLMSAVGTALDTTHMATNIRCAVRGDLAELSATILCAVRGNVSELPPTILAQHFRCGKGLGPEFGDSYLFGNLYKCWVVKVGGLWRLDKVAIKAAWTHGNSDVVNGILLGAGSFVDQDSAQK